MAGDSDESGESALVVRSTTALSTELHVLADAVRETLSYEETPNTERTYASVRKLFGEWCAEHNLVALPAAPATLALYLAHVARDRKLATVQLHLAGINAAHTREGFDPPGDSADVRRYMRSLRKQYADRGPEMQAKPKRALTPEQLAAVRRALDLSTLSGVRDWAVLLFGFALGPRRSEMAALRVADLGWEEDGIRVLIRRGKGDQEGRGETVGVPRGPVAEACPVRALRAWLDVAGVREGALFYRIDRHGNMGGPLSGAALAEIVKRCVARIGLDPAEYAGHSLRRGVATAAGADGVEERAVMKHLRHKSERMTRRYMEDGAMFVDNPASAALSRVAKASKEDR